MDKTSNIWRQSNRLLSHCWIKQEIKREVTEDHKNEEISQQNLWDVTKAVLLQEKFAANKPTSQINNLTSGTRNSVIF